MKTITITLRKKTIQSAYNELKLLKLIGAKDMLKTDLQCMNYYLK